MVLRCKKCKNRTDRLDGTCSTRACPRYRAPRRGWRGGTNAELKHALGPLRKAVGAWLDGGFVLTLLHRHDIRVIIASGMYIRKCWGVSRVMRLEILCVLHLCYWRWSTKLLLEEMEHRLQEYWVAQPLVRAKIWRDVWQLMEGKMEQVQVVAWSDSRTLEVMDRKDVKRARNAASGADFRAYHPYMDPSSRRSGAQQFSILVDSLADGSLWRACEDIARNIEDAPSYTAVTDAMRKHKVSLWQAGSYNCVKLARGLFEAEQVEATWNEEDWNLMSRMGDGVWAAVQSGGLASFAAAQRLCDLISAASGEPYNIASLACFLALGSRCSSTDSDECHWPERARPVTMSVDLDIDVATLMTAQPLARDQEEEEENVQAHAERLTQIYKDLQSESDRLRKRKDFWKKEAKKWKAKLDKLQAIC